MVKKKPPEVLANRVRTKVTTKHRIHLHKVSDQVAVEIELKRRQSVRGLKDFFFQQDQDGNSTLKRFISCILIP